MTSATNPSPLSPHAADDELASVAFDRDGELGAERIRPVRVCEVGQRGPRARSGVEIEQASERRIALTDTPVEVEFEDRVRMPIEQKPGPLASGFVVAAG